MVRALYREVLRLRDMRRLLFVVILAACSHAKPSGPAWPEMAKTEPEDDGGESIAPHESIAAVIEKSDEPEEKKAEPEADKPAETPDATDDKAAPANVPPPPSTDDPVNTEEIIIEIDDD
jgi:hypothetical protein